MKRPTIHRPIEFEMHSDDCCSCSEDESHGIDESDLPKRLTIETPQGLIYVTIDYDGAWKTSVLLPPKLAVLWKLEAGDLPGIDGLNGCKSCGPNAAYELELLGDGRCSSCKRLVN